ncbi:MAG: Mpo1-like protein [Terriglobia bacterium]
MPRRTLTDYIALYDHEHTHPWNKVLHGFGVPAVVTSLVLALFDWRWGLVLFVGGWLLLFLGHKIEGNKPAFFQGIIYLLVGPLWVAKELVGVLRGRRPSKTSSP